MDDADMTADRAEKEAPYLLAASRKPIGPVATGRCLFCDDIAPDDQPWCPGQRWCDSTCRDAWTREANRLGGR